MKRLPLHSLARAKQQGVLEAIEILYVKDVSVMLNCSEKAVRRKVERRLIPFRRWGGRVVFCRKSLMAFLNGMPGCSEAEAQENLRLRNGEAR